MNRVGIDIGSTTVKIAILDDDDQIIFSAYERHFANIQETLKNIINDAYDTLGESRDSSGHHRFRRTGNL